MRGTPVDLGGITAIVFVEKATPPACDLHKRLPHLVDRKFFAGPSRTQLSPVLSDPPGSLRKMNEPAPYRIATVCLGNICRSPIAEAILRQHVQSAALARQVLVESAGTSDWHAGELADHRARAALDRFGYPHAHTARQFARTWFDHLDLILAMDYDNLIDLRRLTTDPATLERIRLLRSFDPVLMHLPEDDPGLAVPDPYYGTATDFDEVVQMVENAAPGVVDYIRLDLG